MLISVLKSKIHRATVTTKNLDYIGSITIDSDLIKKADLIPFEKVQVANINTGKRFETYVIEGLPGSGEIGLNGAAARLAEVGDLVIVLSYGLVEKDQTKTVEPIVIQVDEKNRPADV
jgi:aspartate 1-decarboxylase